MDLSECGKCRVKMTVDRDKRSDARFAEMRRKATEMPSFYQVREPERKAFVSFARI